MAVRHRAAEQRTVHRLCEKLGDFAADVSVDPVAGTGGYSFLLTAERDDGGVFHRLVVRGEPDECPAPLAEDVQWLYRLCGGLRSREKLEHVTRESFTLWSPMGDAFLADMVAAGRLYTAPRALGGSPVSLHTGKPIWRLGLRVGRTPENGYSFAGVQMRTSGEVDEWPVLPPVFTRDGWVLESGVLSRIDPADLPWLALLAGVRGRMEIPAGDLLDFLQQVPEAHGLPPVLNREVLPYRLIQGGDPLPVLRQARSYSPSIHARVHFDYEGHLVPHDAPSRVIPIRDQMNRLTTFVIRSPEVEARRVRELEAQHLVQISPEGPADWSLDEEHVAGSLSGLLSAGWRVELRDGDRDEHVPVTHGAWTLSTASGIDWFDLRGARWDGPAGYVSATARQILDCIDARKPWISMPGGEAVLIPAVIQRALIAFRAGSRPEGEGLRAGASLAGRLLSAALPADTVDGLVSRTSDFPEVPAEPPGWCRPDVLRVCQPRDPVPAFRGTLRAYQRIGLGWLEALRESRAGGCLADDMGLGKTVQVIALLAGHHTAAARDPSLVVVPLTLLENWRRELGVFAPGLRVHIHHGGDRFASIRTLQTSNVVLTTYGMVVSDAHILNRRLFEYVILDEAHLIRNTETKSAQAVRSLQCRHRLALTGTPLINRLQDLQSLFDFLSPGLLTGLPGALRALRQGSRPDADHVRRIGGYLQPFILRRTKREVLHDLPSSTDRVLYCDLDDIEREAYNALRDRYRRELLQSVRTHGLHQQRMHVFEALMRLRQLSCHLGILDERRLDHVGGKLGLLLEHVAQVVGEGHKVLIFSNFVSHLDIIHRHLVNRGFGSQMLQLDGRTRDRADRVHRFQTQPELKIFLISIKAGGLGLNLTSADYVYIADPWWNDATERQAIDRVHRIGQTRPVFAFRLLAYDTVEEKIRELQQRKRELADLVVEEGVPANLSRMTVEDLDYLLT